MSAIARMLAKLAELEGSADTKFADKLKQQQAIHDEIIRQYADPGVRMAHFARRLGPLEFRSAAVGELTRLEYAEYDVKYIGHPGALFNVVCNVLSLYPQEWFAEYDNSAAVVNAVKQTAQDLKASVHNNFGSTFNVR